VDTGKVQYVFRNLPLAGHSNAIGAARAAECALAQGRFWEMHDRLFANQQALSETDLAAHAAAIDLDGKEFQVCMQSTTNSSVDLDQSEAARLGLISTPTFLVGVVTQEGVVKILKKINGAQPYEVFKEALDDAADSL
jgi:protein-disulfide isomerase